MRGSILVVDDSARPRQLLACELEEAGYSVTEAADGDEGWALFCDAEPDLVITDLVMPRCDGHGLLRRIRDRSDVPVIVFSAQGSLEEAVRALKAGADDFVSSDKVAVTEIVGIADGAFDARRVGASESEIEARLAGVGESIQRVRSRVAGLAPLEHPVLVHGEEGTGRDAVVRALHELGSSADGALARIDCARWESSRGLPRASAVYLDGVERLRPSAQAFWADFLRSAPGAGPRVFASSGPLFLSAADPEFSAELRSQLVRFPIELSPLRERPEDVGPIADAIVARLAVAMGRTASLTPRSRELLARQPWRRNVKQLEQLLERAVAFSTTSSLKRDHLLELVDDLEDSLGSIRRRRQQLERESLIEALHRTGGNVSQTADLLGRSRGAVYRLMEKHGVSASSA